MMSDLFTSGMVCSGRIARKSKIVIRPLGAINNSGEKGNFEIYSASHLTKIIATTMAAAQGMV